MSQTTPSQDEPTYQQRIDALRQTKAEHTALKIELFGHFDTDDHGYIPWTDPIPFKAVPNHPSGGCWGIRGIGENFRRWLEAHPLYIHPMSSLAGAWVYKSIPGVAGHDWPRVRGQERPRRNRDDGPTSWRPEDRPRHLFPLIRKYNIYNHGMGAPNHLGPDMTIGLRLGWGGLLDKVRYYRALNRPTDTSFYDGEEQLILGVQTWIRRHVELAQSMAEAEPNPTLRENLRTIAEVNDWLVEGAPRTLREACQFLVWFQSIDRMWGLGGAMGQLDELLRPYYEADLAAGRETDESVVWHLASLFFNDPHYSQIGGQAPDGRDLTSPMSFLVLEAMHRLRTPANIALRVHEGMDRELLRRAVTYICEDGTGVSFACSKGLDEGFCRNGHPLPLARMRAKVGCNWTALPGVEYCLQDVTRVCLVTPLLLALDDILADASVPRTMESLWERYAHHLGIAVDVVKEGKDLHMERQASNWPEIVLNLFCHGPIERGVDASAGGVDIVDLAMDGIGLATVADSFAAIEQRVVQEGRLTWEELGEHLRNDFAGAEHIRLMLHNIPRYGAGGTRADWWAKRVADCWSHLVRDTPTPKGFVCIPGMFSHGGTARYGERLGATPNGRHAGEALSHSADPDPGFLQVGNVAATAKASAVAAVQPRWGNTTPLQIELDQSLVKSLGGIEAVENLILAHNAQGGTLINMNVLSKEQILEAHADPSTHPDLVIRVTGYSAYFRSLSREYRQPIVDRILAEG
ncbi:MAG: pyruvate-formate lyase [Chloroflexi bacterium]|jgi:pyruvate-formate lyase|nr:pyruvate-formate lyase [Chloroflexota bacterium]